MAWPDLAASSQPALTRAFGEDATHTALDATVTAVKVIFSDEAQDVVVMGDDSLVAPGPRAYFPSGSALGRAPVEGESLTVRSRDFTVGTVKLDDGGAWAQLREV